MARFVTALREQGNLSELVTAPHASAVDWALAIWRECMRMEVNSGGLDPKTKIAASIIGVIVGGKEGG